MRSPKTNLIYQQLIAVIAITLCLSLSGCSLMGRNSGPHWDVILQIDAPAAVREDALKQTIRLIENRLNAVGVSHPSVRIEGDSANGQIRVSVPASVDHERLKRLLTAQGKLELFHIISNPSPAPLQTYATKEEAVASLKIGDKIPPDRRVLAYPGPSEHEPPGVTDIPRLTKWVVVESPAIVAGKDLRDAHAYQNQARTYGIAFSLTKDAANRFGEWTAAHIGEYLGVALNDELKSAAYIKSQIFDQGEITGNFGKEAADELALVLKSGSLPYPVSVLSES